jgi:hypothetical protein
VAQVAAESGFEDAGAGKTGFGFVGIAAQVAQGGE